MLKTIFARKVGMTAKYDAAGKMWGATVLQIPDQQVIGKRTTDKHGYQAAVIEIKNSKIQSRKKSNREIRGDYEEEGEVKWTEIVKPGDYIKVTGISKGKGFAGVVKRYNFKGGPRTHGQSDRERARGSSGSTTTPGRVFKGKRMAGRMGNDTVTIKNLQVLEVDSDKRMLIVRGGVPGSARTLVRIQTV